MPMLGLKKILQKAWTLQEKYKTWIQIFSLFLAAGALVIQFSTFTALFFDAADSIGIVMAYDNDSSAGIEIAEKTWLINHNGSAMYGPIYYRLGAPFRSLLTNSYGPESSPSEARERSIHFHMMILNLVAVVLTALFFMWFITRDRFYQIFGAFILVSLILHNQQRANLLFMVKPDHLAAFLILVAGLLTLLWLKDRNNSKRLNSMTAAWAVAASTKLSVIFFGPGILSLWWPFKANRRQFLIFMRNLVVLYLIIGFPQNLDVGGYASYLLQMNQYSKVVDWDFFIHGWMNYFALDLWLPLAGLVVLTLIVPLRKDWDFSFRNLGRWGIFLLLSILFLCSKKTTAPYEWYTFPFVNLIWFFVAAVILSSQKYIKKIPGQTRIGIIKNHHLTPLFVFSLAAAYFPTFPKAVWDMHQATQYCRPEAQLVESMVNRLALDGRMILSDPYIPFDFQMNKKLKRVLGSWEMSQDLLQKVRPEFVALKKNYYQIYLSPTSSANHLRIHPEKAQAAQDFYLLFSDKTHTVDRWGQKWKKIHQDKCSFELWEKEK